MRFESRVPLRGNPNHKAKAVRDAIANFERLGVSSHSPHGTLGAHVLNHCVENDIPFTLQFEPRGGFCIQKGTEA